MFTIRIFIIRLAYPNLRGTKGYVVVVDDLMDMYDSCTISADIIVPTWLILVHFSKSHYLYYKRRYHEHLLKFLPASVFKSIQLSVLSNRVVVLWIIRGQNVYLKLLQSEFFIFRNNAWDLKLEVSKKKTEVSKSTP